MRSGPDPPGSLVGGGAAALGAALLSGAARAQSAAILGGHAAPRRLAAVDHAIVYRREDEFTSWLHTMGFWNMGDGELLQNFPAIKSSYGDANAISHDNVGGNGASKLVTVRSKDWGRTWGRRRSDDQRLRQCRRGHRGRQDARRPGADRLFRQARAAVGQQHQLRAAQCAHLAARLARQGA
ncbi:MAG: hypothetical protein WDN24_19875 [Sphingomonas sp.]